jgi:hypothetical protein
LDFGQVASQAVKWFQKAAIGGGKFFKSDPERVKEIPAQVFFVQNFTVV